MFLSPFMYIYICIHTLRERQRERERERERETEGGRLVFRVVQEFCCYSRSSSKLESAKQASKHSLSKVLGV